MERQAFVAKCMEIKAKISVAKDNLNDFGGYKYRTIEDILAVAKPVLVGTGIELQTDVDVSIIGDKFLVTAYATLTDGENRETTKGLAFYDADHKKMSDEQKLGSASTYAIRYAMTNLLLAGSGEADLDSLPPKDYKGQGQQNGQRTQQAAPTYQAPRSQYQRAAQAPRQQYQQQAPRPQYQQQAPARQQTAAPQQPASTAPARQQVTAPTAPAPQKQQTAPQQAAATPARQQVTAAPAPQATTPSVPASQAAAQKAPAPQQAPAPQSTGQQAPAQSAGRIPMHEIKPGYDLTGQVKDIYKIQPGREPIYGPYSPQACIFQYDSKGRALRPKACIITKEEDT